MIGKTYKFPLATGVLKDRKARARLGKDPRPIVVANVESRVVQRAILQVLQVPAHHALYAGLGRIREINASPYSFGSVPDGGVPKAMKAVRAAIQDGYVHAYKTDISDFFTQIPHRDVVAFVREQTNSEELAHFFEMGLRVELANKDELSRYYDLFPQNGVGVPQGSSLSAFAGNVLLDAFDIELNGRPNVRAFRYVDDLLILGRSNDDVQKAKGFAVGALRKLHMRPYDPAKNPDKAGEGHLRAGVEYLGFEVRISSIMPSKKAQLSIVERVKAEIDAAKRAIADGKFGEAPRFREAAYFQSLTKIDLILNGWANSYRISTDRLIFTRVDLGGDRIIKKYDRWMSAHLGRASPTQKRRMLGVSLIGDVKQMDL